VGAVDFRILGSLEVWDGGRQVTVAGSRQRALLASLLLHAGEVVSSDRLIDEVWEEKPPEAGAAALRVRISQLRRALGPAGELLVTHPPGYVMHLAPEQLDLQRFERLAEAGERALAADDPATAAECLREALAMWRGAPLADFAYAPFAQAAIARLEDLRLAATELRVEADLRLGRHARLVGELRALVRDHPLRERPCCQLMLALYRDGRQTEALETYRAARGRLVDEVGLEPGPDLRELERQILAQDPALRLDRPRPAPSRAILVLPAHDATIDALVGLAEPLAARGGHELLIAALVDDATQVSAAAARLHTVRAGAAERGVTARTAAFSSPDRAADVVRLANDEDVALLLLDAPEELLRAGSPDDVVAGVLAHAACDVALVAGAQRGIAAADAPVLVPFGGHQHDWAAVELGAWIASASGVPLRLVGTRADPGSGRRDASRLLGSASLALQHALGVAAEPVLVEPGTDAIVEAADGAALVIAGLSDRWAREGLGTARLELARRAATPVLLVRRGLRPGGLAPPRALTRFTWSVG
jgi:DNA-binding SARP family transcriptional activator